MFPFSPFAHDASNLNYGFSPGTLHTLLWPNNMKKHATVYPGDDGVRHALDMKEEFGPSIDI